MVSSDVIECFRSRSRECVIMTGKVYEYCMFHNEHAVLDLKLRESGKFVDQLHLCEANKTFKGGTRIQALRLVESSFVKPHLLDAEKAFHPGYSWGPSRKFPFFRKRKMARKNETIQRNHVHRILREIDDTDLVILSDIDEIIDSRFADEIIEKAKQYGIVSIEMHHTLFYLNLYSTNWQEVWPNSPANYAYRVFVLTGARFRSLHEKSDRLRRRGEWNQLGNEVHLIKGFKGFHHSWLGDEDAALEKLASYAHSVSEHRPDLADANGKVTREALAKFIRAGESIFPGNRLEIRSFEEIQPLASISSDRDKFAKFLL